MAPRHLLGTALIATAVAAAPAGAASCEMSGAASVTTPAGGAHVSFWNDPGMPSGDTWRVDAGASVAGGPGTSFSHVETKEPGPGLVEQVTGVDVVGLVCS